MTKHAKKSAHLQAVDSPKTKIVEIPLPAAGRIREYREFVFRPVRSCGPAGPGCDDGTGSGGPVRSTLEARP